MAHDRREYDRIVARTDRRRPVGVGALLAMVALLAACGAQTGTVVRPVKHETHVAVPMAHGALDLRAVKQSVESERFLRIRGRLDLTVDGTTMKATDIDEITDSDTGAVSMAFAPNPVVGLSGWEQRMFESTAYVKSDDADQWTELVMDPTLIDPHRSDVLPNAPPNLLDTFDAMGIELRPDGSEVDEGVTYRRFSGDLDWNEMIDAMRSSSDLGAQGFSRVPDGVDVEGTASVLLGEDGAPHRFSFVIDSQKDGKRIRVSSVNTYVSTEGITGIDRPEAGQVADTVQIHSADDLMRALQDATGF